MKTCTKCKTEKELNSFAKYKKAKDGLCSWCKSCWRKYRAERKTYYAEQNIKYRLRHKEKGKQYRKEHQEQRSKYHQTWVKNNSEKLRFYGQKRRSYERRLVTSLTLAQWEDTKLYFNNSCAYCGRHEELHQDHFIALSNYGEYSHNNIIPVCRHCNSSKHTSSFFDWYPEQKFYSKNRMNKILKFLNYENGFQQLSIGFVDDTVCI